MNEEKLYLALVGLPARGKTTLATKLKENLMGESVKTRIFNNGDLRRKMIRDNTSYAGFYNPDNLEGVAFREQIAQTNMERAQRYLAGKGNVAILDATNVSIERREKIQACLHDHPILFVECINNDKEILDASIMRKINMPEFGHLTQEEAITSFQKRIGYYESINEPLEREKDFIRLNSLNCEILEEEINNDIPYYEQIRDYLATDIIKNLYLIRHGETFFNLENRIGGDSPLTQKGHDQAGALALFFKRKKIPLIFTSNKARTIQTAQPIRDLQDDCTIIGLPEFNEIDSGICECMSYDEIKEQMQEIHTARKKDKYNYAYPRGEGYITMQERINRGIKKALYLSNPSDNIMIIGHRAVNRMILSHFLFRRVKDVPYIYIPQDKFYYISSTPNRKLFQLKRYH